MVKKKKKQIYSKISMKFRINSKCKLYLIRKLNKLQTKKHLYT